MKVLCNGYKKCSYNCRHKVPHNHNKQYDCDSECCESRPYHCTQESLILYDRRSKLEKISMNEEINKIGTEIVQYIRELTNDHQEGYSGMVNEDGTIITMYINKFFKDHITYSSITKHIVYYHNNTYTDLTDDFKTRLRKLKLEKIRKL